MRKAYSRLSGEDGNGNRDTSRRRLASFDMICSESMKSKRSELESSSLGDHLFSFEEARLVDNNF